MSFHFISFRFVCDICPTIVDSLVLMKEENLCRNSITYISYIVHTHYRAKLHYTDTELYSISSIRHGSKLHSKKITLFAFDTNDRSLSLSSSDRGNSKNSFSQLQLEYTKSVLSSTIALPIWLCLKIQNSVSSNLYPAYFKVSSSAPFLWHLEKQKFARSKVMCPTCDKLLFDSQLFFQFCSNKSIKALI